MTPEQVERARLAAAQVVDGFKTVRTQQARDVLALCASLELHRRTLLRLREELRKVQPGGAKPTENDFGGFAGLFDDIFGQIAKGAKK